VAFLLSALEVFPSVSFAASVLVLDKRLLRIDPLHQLYILVGKLIVVIPQHLHLIIKVSIGLLDPPLHLFEPGSSSTAPEMTLGDGVIIAEPGPVARKLI
jgi:hypothetical protein